ncbi:MAG TPA: ubiquinone/menaquinone biosynthesis methyltransferase [bacterium]|nr:ubiquinone/menaquinone biosynthesis methyltransferase [bacterium]
MPYRLPSPQDRARYVRDKFDEIARHYDLFNDLITQGQHRWWKRVLVRRLGIAPDARGLDLCCGTGDIAARCLRRLGPQGRLVAADFSSGMLAIARRRLARTQPGQGDTPLALRGDAMRLPFRDASFDFVSIGYGLRNVSDLGACLEEILRVLRPGGAMASLDVGKVRNRWLRPLAEFYMFRIVPRIGGLLQPGQDMFTYLPHSTVAFPDQHALARRLEAIGFSQVEVIEHLFGASALHVARKPL